MGGNPRAAGSARNAADGHAIGVDLPVISEAADLFRKLPAQDTSRCGLFSRHRRAFRTQARDDGGHIRGFLKQADRGDTRGPRGKARSRVLDVTPPIARTGIRTEPQTSRSVRYLAAGRTLPLMASRTRAEENIVRASALGRARRFDRMARYADLEFHAAGGAAPLRHRFHWQRRFPQVDSRCARGERDIQPVIDQNLVPVSRVSATARRTNSARARASRSFSRI